MRHLSRNPLILGIVLLPLITACIPRVPPPVTVPPEMPTGSEFELQQEMLVMSFITYTGESLIGSDDEVEGELVPCVRKALDTQPLTAGNWDLVWGPAVFKFAGTKLDDNMMFVAGNRQDPSRLVVATRRMREQPQLARALVHGSWGPAGQGQAVAVLEAAS